MWHRECYGGKIEIKEIKRGSIDNYKNLRMLSSYESSFLPLLCLRCKIKLWIDLKDIEEIKGMANKIIITAFDGKKRKITNYGVITDKIDYLHTNPERKKVKVTVIQKKPEIKEKSKVQREIDEIYCPYCGKLLSPEVSICPFCGTEIEDRILEMRLKKVK
ncbi:MAG: zinc ribbon domain-containing protein [Candidatus Nealsonbacteria bacterium]